MKPVGFWINDTMYRMYDPRTHETRTIAVCALDGNPSEPEEAQDVIEEYIERFEADLKDTPDHVDMALSQQHELAPHLRAIESTKRRFRETGNRRYH